MQPILLQIQSITLTQFKNYSQQSFQFSERIIGICGKNGVGKTNLLDAIHYLSFAKSHFNRIEQLNSLHGYNGFRIEATIQLNNKEENVICIVREDGKKEFLLNDVPYQKMANHIGRYPCVMIAPDDIHIITGISEDRRRWMDRLFSQLDSVYLSHLVTYNRLLQQRNFLLRNFAESNVTDFTLLDVLDEQMQPPANYIFEKRNSMLQLFITDILSNYKKISAVEESLAILYETELQHTSFAELLKWNRKNDLAALRTTGGIHRDEILFKINKQLFKNIASQGQRKSLLFALKLTEFEVLKSNKGFSPILLLDDVFEKLDEDRIGNLLQEVCTAKDGQVFITDTNRERLAIHLKQFTSGFAIIDL